MANTFFGLTIGTSGLYAANANLNVTANNIANEKTVGYSRQQAVQQATTALRVYQRYGAVGTGVEVTEINRTRDEYYDIKYWNNQTKFGEYSTKNYYMLQLEDHFNDSEESGFSKEYNNIFDALNGLKKDAGSTTARATVLNYMDSFLEYMEEIKTNLSLVQEDINAEMNNYVDKINSISSEVATINKQINVIELTGANANELRDKRAVLLDELSQIVDIDTKEVTYDNGKSEFYVTVGNKSLVNNYDYFSLKVETRDEQADTNDAAGLYDTKWSYGDEFDVIGDEIHGSLYSLIQVRDGNNGVAEAGNDASVPVDYKGVPYYYDQINSFLDSFTKQLNEIQAKGQGLNGEAGADNPIFLVSDNGHYSVNPDMLNNPSLFATTTNVANGTAAYDLTDEMINTKNSKNYQGGTAIEFLNSIVTEVAIDTKKTTTMETNYTNIQKNIQNQRLSVMGVDADEEAMNLVKYKEAYDLSSKVISVMNEIYSKLINETGV